MHRLLSKAGLSLRAHACLGPAWAGAGKMDIGRRELGGFPVKISKEVASKCAPELSAAEGRE